MSFWGKTQPERVASPVANRKADMRYKPGVSKQSPGLALANAFSVLNAQVMLFISRRYSQSGPPALGKQKVTSAALTVNRVHRPVYTESPPALTTRWPPLRVLVAETRTMLSQYP